MACIVKIKGREEFKQFNSEQEAQEWLESVQHLCTIEEFPDPDNKDKMIKYLHIQNPGNEPIVKTIMAANKISWNETREDYKEVGTGDWKQEEYEKNSKAVSLSTALSKIRKPDGSRLFPEFITNNYLNVLIQKTLLEKLIGSNITTEIRDRYFGKISISGQDGILHSAKTWYEQIKSKFPNKTINDDELNKIDHDVQEVNNTNFESMLIGEICHKTFESICKYPRRSAESLQKYEERIKTIVNNIFNEFNKKYNSEKYKDVINPESIISRVQSFYDDKFKSYFNTCLSIKSHFEQLYADKDISWLCEQRITADLDTPITDNGGEKTKIRGKMDVLLIVDGKIHVIDLKVSRKSFSQWDNAKILKTDYQLGSYDRMLNKVGVGGATTLSIANIILNEDNSTQPLPEDNSWLIPRAAHINGDYSIKKTLDEFFTIVKATPQLSGQLFEEVKQKMDKLFGETSQKSKTVISEETLIDSLKRRLHTNKRGDYILTYNIFDEKTARETTTTVTIKKNEIDSKLTRIARQIIDNRNRTMDIRYNTLIADLKQFFETGQSINSWKSVGDNVDLINMYGALFYKYRGMNAKVIESDLAKENGLIFVQTEAGIDIIAVTQFDPHIDYDQSKKNQPLFSTAKVATPDSKLKLTVGNVAITKALLVANTLSKNSQIKIGNVTCIQLGSNRGHFLRQKDLENLSDMLSQINMEKNYLENRFMDPIANVLNICSNFVHLEDGKVTMTLKYTNSLNSLEKHLKPNQIKELQVALESGELDVPNFITPLNREAKLAILYYMRDILKQNYITLFAGTDIPTISMETVLMAMIEQAIQVYTNTEVSDEMGLKKYSLSTSILFNSLDTIPNENAQIIRRSIDNGFSKIRERLAIFTSRNRTMVDRLKKEKEYGIGRAYIVGDTSIIYDNLFRRDENGVVSDLILKKLSDITNPAEKAFLKHMLFTLNKRTYKWKTIDEFNESKLQETDYYVPLVRNRYMSRFRDINGNISTAKFKSMFEKMRNVAISGEDIFEEQASERTNHVNNFERFYNQFDRRRDKDLRKSVIERLGIESFNTDLETILTAFVLAEESQDVFDTEVIPTVRSVLYTSHFNTHITGEDQSIFEEFVVKNVKNIVYGESVMEPEVQTMMKNFAPVRTAAFYIGLGWNVMNLPREMLMGFFTNISRAMFSTYGEETFTFQDYMKAIGIMSGDIPGFIASVTKIELLNEFYGMSNMSITEIPEQVTSNKTGIFATFSRFMSWALTAPDYWNRMSMFISQMIHDGTWEAHEIYEDPDGFKQLKYDIAKDKRFNVFYKYASDPRYNGDISWIPNSDKQKFNHQMALYQAMLDELNETSDNPYYYTPGDKVYLPKAYTNRQRNSMKSFADTTFGYYDVETKALFFKTAVGQIFKQFMAYMAGKKVQYYQAGSDVVARGSFEQVTDNTGEKLWKIGTTVKKNSELTADERISAIPVLAWKGAYIEGIFQSYMNLFKELGIGTWDALSGKNTDAFKRIWREYGKKGHIRHSNLLQGLWDVLIANFFIALIRMMFYNDPEVVGLSYEQQIEQSSALSQHLYSIADQATRDFDAIALIKDGIFTWNITSFDILKRAGRTWWKNLGDDDLSLAEATLSSAVETTGALKPIRPYVKEWKEEWQEN